MNESKAPRTDALTITAFVYRNEEINTVLVVLAENVKPIEAELAAAIAENNRLNGMYNLLVKQQESVCETAMKAIAERDEARKLADKLASAFQFPDITFGNAGAMAYHLMQGKDNAGLTRELLSAWLESIKVKGQVYGQSQIEYHQAAARWQEEGKV